jgi:hypothetical protein
MSIIGHLENNEIFSKEEKYNLLEFGAGIFTINYIIIKN